MECGLCKATGDVFANEFLRYTLSTAIGFAGAYGVQWLRDWRYDNRVRASVRESLAQEIADDLEKLDSFKETFQHGQQRQAEGTPVITWPGGRLNTAMLERCLDPALGSLLTRGEETKIALVYYQASWLQSEMDEAHEKILAAGSGAPAKLAHEYDRLLTRVIPAVAQNMVDFLVQLVSEQVRFASSQLIEVSVAMLPYHSSGITHAKRIWQTSEISPRNRIDPDDKAILAWRNDDPSRVPEGVRVVELRPMASRQFTVGMLDKPETSWLEGRRLRKWRRDVRSMSERFREELANRTGGEQQRP